MDIRAKYIGLQTKLKQSAEEIRQVAGFAYAIALGTMDFNIIKDNWTENKQ